MIGLIQRVTEASVKVNNQNVGKINTGLLLLLGIEKDDTQTHADKLLSKVLKYRVFEDNNEKMNLSLLDTSGDLLVISQFTLAANTTKGLRPGFEPSAKPELAEPLYEYFIQQAKQSIANTQTGVFGADMKVSLVNDGPVTFWLQVS